jgi:tetratricopeptide (TPR) repeat protein
MSLRFRSRLVPGLVASVLLAGLTPAAPAQDSDTPRRGSGDRVLKPADLRPMEVRFWEDRGFRDAFLASYIPATSIEPDVTEDERERVQELLALIGEGSFDEAITRIARLRTDASTAVYEFLLGNIHFQADRLDEAAAAYLEAVRKYPNFRRAWKNLGLIRVKQQDFASALPALSKVIELGGGDGRTYGLLGFGYASTGDSIAAESAYRMAILLDPGTIDWKMQLGRALFMQQRYADAAALVGRLIEQNPAEPNLWILQANAFIGLGEPRRAAENYEMVDKLGASTVDTLNMLGDIYINEGLFDAAVATYDRAMEMDLDSRPERALRAARVMVAQGAYAPTKTMVQAIKDLYGYTLEDADRKELLRVEARIAVAEGAGEEQVRILEEIIRLDPLDGDALLLLGQHHHRQDEAERAIFYFERAASLPAFEADAKVRHAQVLVGQQRYAEALPLLRQAQSVRPRESVRDFIEQVERFAARG